MTTSAASPSPVPRVPGQDPSSARDGQEDSRGNGPKLPTPTLRLHLNDLRHPASTAFLSLLPDVTSVLETALSAIIKHLYTPPSLPPSAHPQDAPLTASAAAPATEEKKKQPCITFTPSIPPTRSVTLVLRDFSGVAYTTGIDLDNDHKEIHFSLSYIRTWTTRYPDPVSELAGVLTHELVHCYQHISPPQAPDGDGEPVPRPPGGLIEGIADFVRLKAGLVPPHWKRPTGAEDRTDRWDQGYQHTAFFLEWLEDVRVGTGAVGMLNDRLLRVGYVGEDDDASMDGDKEGDGKEGFWKELFGAGVLQLWEEYGRYLDSLGEKEDRKDTQQTENK
ncbi:hypothetical protein VTN00DRAFT_9053 [Thermoascus crustaceus]|uniref:uncharacterized protein n=1 Tax=Thermoascus crustaceus TaxID=5088 RepID=UPI003744A8BC